MKPKSPAIYFLGYVALVLAAYFVWQVPMIKKAIGGTVA